MDKLNTPKHIKVYGILGTLTIKKKDKEVDIYLDYNNEVGHTCDSSALSVIINKRSTWIY